jgi:hypothetical protein
MSGGYDTAMFGCASHLARTLLVCKIGSFEILVPCGSVGGSERLPD